MKLNYKSEDFANPYIVKCALIGHYGVGKSTLGHMFEVGKFDNTITTTIGIDFFTKTIKLPEYNNHSIKLQIWDTAGQEKFKSIITSYLRDVFVAFIMFDMTNRESWEDIDVWKGLVNNKTSIPRVVLVGTKSDKRDHVVTIDEINQKSKEWNCNSYILSSKQSNSSSMIYRMFSIETYHFHTDMVNNHRNGEELPFGILEKDNSRLSLNDYEPNPKWCCFQ